MSSPSVPVGHVGLIILQEENSSKSFYLQIPIHIIKSLCLAPRKYLQYLGWCILGVEGELALKSDGNGISTGGDLDNRGIYYYIVADGTSLTHAVDLEVIKKKTEAPSETTQTREGFRVKLLERDTCCIWTGITPESGVGMHIIPYKRGSDWFRLIVQNRPHYSENVADLTDINDIRNGVFANLIIHHAFHARKVAVLKTPNHILRSRDIPPRCNRNFLPEDVCYPTGSRYTLQWLVAVPDPGTGNTVPNNADATFKKYTTRPKPSELILHYNYGAAAVACWGRGIEVLKNATQPPRPPAPVASPAGPSKTIHDRNIAIGKRHAGQAAGGVRTGTAAGTGAEEMVESESQGKWDADDVMLFFWGNTQAAKERRLKKAHDDAQRMELWRADIPHFSETF